MKYSVLAVSMNKKGPRADAAGQGERAGAAMGMPGEVIEREGGDVPGSAENCGWWSGPHWFLHGSCLALAGTA